MPLIFRIATARLLSLYLSLAPALLLAATVAALLLRVASAENVALLSIGMFGLSGLAVIAGALIAAARGGEAVAGLVVLPLALPMLIFGSAGDWRLLAASSLFVGVIAPFGAAAALRASLS